MVRWLDSTKDLYDESISILKCAQQDEELFALIYTVDDGDDWRDPAVLAKANPNMGISVKREYLLSQQQRAIRNPRYTNIFKTKHLNVWVNASCAFFNMEHWIRAENLDMRLDDYIDCNAWFSLDLASKLDVCSFVQLFVRRAEDGLLHYYCFSRHYLPEDTIFSPDQKNSKLYTQWTETLWDNCDGSVLTVLSQS